MSIAENSLGLSTVADLIDWTTSYLHFKHVLEQVPLQPEEAQIYLEAFTPFRERLAEEINKQAILEARLPKEMRDKIAADKPNLVRIRELLG